MVHVPCSICSGRAGSPRSTGAQLLHVLHLLLESRMLCVNYCEFCASCCDALCISWPLCTNSHNSLYKARQDTTKSPTLQEHVEQLLPRSTWSRALGAFDLSAEHVEQSTWNSCPAGARGVAAPGVLGAAAPRDQMLHFLCSMYSGRAAASRALLQVL